MVTKIINVEGITLFQAKNHPPVRANGDCPKPFVVSLQEMQAEAGHVHIRNRGNGIKTHQNIA